MNRKTYLYLSICLILLSVGAVYLDSQLESGYHASWIYNYKDISEIQDASDLIIIGTVTKSAQEKSDEPGNNLIFTRFTVSIDQVISGKTSLKEVSVRQLGGQDGSELVEIQDDPLMTMDSEVILFLKEYEPNKFKIIGGPQGRFIIENDKVYSVGEYEENNFMITSQQHTGGKLLSDFLKSMDK